MGDEQKIVNLYKELKDIQDIIEDTNMDLEIEEAINERFFKIDEIYRDFMDNYLDFREISDNLYDGIYISNGQGVTIFVNEAYLRNTGLKREQLIGKTVKQITEAPTDVTILITGESGTGKEVVADEIYNKSKRNDKAFIKVNCAAIPEELLESELFGYEGGAFTDARKSGKIGLFELANGGTILLDEIGEMQLSLQSKLLRVLQTKEIVKIGGNKSIKLDIRVMASTNRDLQEEIKKGRFREDLYYRLNVVPIYVKPLRERKEIIPNLTKMFIDKYNKKYGKETIMQEEAMYLLLEYKWPGNIRELENLIERMVVINNDGIIKYNSIASILNLENSGDNDSDTITLKDMVERLEKDIITKSIRKHGSVNKAAAVLGLSQPALWKKCQKLNIH